MEIRIEANRVKLQLPLTLLPSSVQLVRGMASAHSTMGTVGSTGVVGEAACQVCGITGRVVELALSGKGGVKVVRLQPPPMVVPEVKKVLEEGIRSVNGKGMGSTVGKILDSNLGLVEGDTDENRYENIRGMNIGEQQGDDEVVEEVVEEEIDPLVNSMQVLDGSENDGVFMLNPVHPVVVPGLEGSGVGEGVVGGGGDKLGDMNPSSSLSLVADESKVGKTCMYIVYSTNVHIYISI